jgi:predicted sulfurtransferase
LLLNLNVIKADRPRFGERSAIKVDPHCQKIKHLEASDWDEALRGEKVTLIDVRNHYEYELGHFFGARRLKTNVFRESYDALDDALCDVNKKDPLLIYCTGGIRCVKVGSYLYKKVIFFKLQMHFLVLTLFFCRDFKMFLL